MFSSSSGDVRHVGVGNVRDVTEARHHLQLLTARIQAVPNNNI